MSSLLTLALCHSISLSLSLVLSVCLVCLCDSISAWSWQQTTLLNSSHTYYCCARISSLAARKFLTPTGNPCDGISAAPNGMRRGWGSERRKKACLIISLITPVTIPKLFCTESAREYANRHRCTALVCWAWAGEKSALWCFLVLNFKRKVKNVQEFSL